MEQTPAAPRRTWFSRFLQGVESVGNALPQPASLFALLAVGIVGVSAWAASAGLSVTHPATGQSIAAVSLFNLDGFRRIVTHLLPNFVDFPPLGVVVVCLLGIAVAEHTGLLGAGVRLLVLAAPRRLITPMVVFAGIMSNVGGDVGYVLLIPLAAAIFHAVGRHPVAGLAAAFAGVSGGFSANLFVGTIDVLLAGLTQSAAAIVTPGYKVTGLANYYFMVASTFVLTAAGTWVTHRVVEPRLGAYTGPAAAEPLVPLSAEEKRGLWCAAGFSVVMAGVILAGVVPQGGFLRDPAHPDSLLRSLLLTHLVPFIFAAGLGVGLAYGLGAGTVRSDRPVVKGMERSMSTLGSYLVLAFFAAQFIAFFNWTNLGLIIAVKGAGVITSLGLESMPIPLMLAVVLFSSVINLAIGSASAKWALLAPVFVPMFMLLGYTPELVQAAYRVGDSCTNVITPLMGYFPLILSFVHRYIPSAGIGTMIATMLPYSIAFVLVWAVLLVLWLLAGIPVGVDAPLTLPSS